MVSVSVILGSDSDIPVYEKVKEILNNFGIQHESRILSAHRTPEELKDYIKSAEKKGIKVFIGIAGLSAALPGAIASYTTRPVIGVPALGRTSPGGLDALLSIAQMPPGVPVAAVGIENGQNAALLALRILGVFNENLDERLKKFAEDQKELVLRKDKDFQG